MLKRIQLTEVLCSYLVDVSVRETDVLRRLRKETAALPLATMQIPPEEGQFLSFLVRLMGARRTLEVGVFTGYSTLWTAAALPPDGRLVACDISEEWTSIARRYWREAGVDHQIELRIGPAADVMQQLLREAQADSFDFVFIDADKEQILEYYELALKLVRPNGVIAIDNVLYEGEVADPAFTAAAPAAVRALNERLHDDPRIALSLVPIADGVTLAMKLAAPLHTE
jgi:caffeoyl-CoA O-methyltransferase